MTNTEDDIILPVCGPEDEKLFTTRDLYTVVDKNIYPTLRAYRWTASPNGRGKVYVKRAGRKSEGILHKKTIFLHRMVAGVVQVPGLVVDHADGNPLNNTLRNLRLSSHLENSLNADQRGEVGTSRFRGVYIYPPRDARGRSHGKKRVVAYVNVNGTRHHVGRFSLGEEEQAARARDECAIRILKELGVQTSLFRSFLNFPKLIDGGEEREPNPIFQQGDVPF